MKESRFKILAAVLAVALLATVAFSQNVVKTTQGIGHRGGGFAAHMLGFYADYLDLTDTQQAQMKDILAKEKPTIRPLMQQLAQGRQQMRQLEQAGFEEAKVRGVATQQAQAMTELMVQKARIKSELVALLTPDQKDKMAKFEARRQARFQKHFQQGQPPQPGQAPPSE
jgi:Spy/CpxP family protein refolding chaperone